MTKSEFLEKLKSALGNDLSGAIIQENVNYYNSYISEETGKGRTEAEVIEELGDPWALARTIIDAAEGRDTADGCSSDGYGYETQQKAYGGQKRSTGHVYSFGFDSWWKKLLLILAVIGVIMVVAAVISGLVSFLAPLIVPLLIIMIIIRAVNGRR